MSPARRDALLLTCEHAGNRVPARYRKLFAPHRDLLASHRGWDPGALPIARAIARELNTPLLFTTVTRLLVETNRSPGHPALFSSISSTLPVEEMQRALDLYYTPHRDAVMNAVRERIRTGARVVHIGVHTFTPVLNGVTRRTDIGLLYDPRRPQESVFCARWAKSLHSLRPALRLRRNYPYRGAADGLTTALRRALSPNAYLGIELEVNQALAIDKNPRARRALAAAIARSLQEIL